MNMSWYGMEEHQTIVIDNGSTSIRAGFAPTRDGLPDTIFPAVVGRPKNPDLFAGMGQKSFYVGDEIGSAARSNLIIRYPIERGIITNWDDMEKIWHHVFNNELRVTPSDHPVLLTEVGLNPKAHREKMTQIMFETFEVPGLYITPSASIALYAYGRTNGVVLTSGGGVTQAVPVYSLHPIQHGITQLDIGGNDITQHLIKLIKESHNIDFSTGIEVREMDYIKTKCTFVAEEYEFLLKNLPPEANYDVFDGHITLKEDRFKAPEILFNPSLFGLEASGVHELIFNAVMKSDESIRKELFQAVALAGGNTVIPGFTERLTKELRSIVPKEFNTHVIPPSDPKNAPFLGAARIGGSSIFLDMCMTKEDYEEMGPGLVNRSI